MSDPRAIDGVLVEWGERVLSRQPPRDAGSAGAPSPSARPTRRGCPAEDSQHAAASPQAMVKVTGGGRGMGAIAAHFRYISKGGRLQMEDDRGVVREGREAVAEVAEQWRYAGSLIPQQSERREAFNIVLSMPHGTDPQFVLRAARDFAKAELADHRYVMVLHEHQANPHGVAHLIEKMQTAGEYESLYAKK